MSHLTVSQVAHYVAPKLLVTPLRRDLDHRNFQREAQSIVLCVITTLKTGLQAKGNA